MRPSLLPISRQRNAAAVLLERSALRDLAEPAFEIRHFRALRHQLHVAADHYADWNVAIGKFIARHEAGLAELRVHDLRSGRGLLLAGIDRSLIALLGRCADQA